jgi:hypothetical protein
MDGYERLIIIAALLGFFGVVKLWLWLRYARWLHKHHVPEADKQVALLMRTLHPSRFTSLRAFMRAEQLPGPTPLRPMQPAPTEEEGQAA